MTVIDKEITYFRAGAAGVKDDSRVVRDGGHYAAGLIEGFSVITRGEALGHGMWIDSLFVADVQAQFDSKGVTSRYTHPGMSGDALSKKLGRAFDAELQGDQVYADLHLQKNAHKSPDGDLAEHVMSIAEEDPESFGASIVFEHDIEAYTEFHLSHGAELIGSELDFTNFQSPDELNTKNLPHAMLGTLRNVDIVSDPAANPDGLFCVDPTFEKLESFACYAMGLSEELPESLNGLDPRRARSFLNGFLNKKELHIMANSEKQPVDDSELKTGENVDETPQELGDPRAEAKRFYDAFGEKGAAYYAQGMTFEEAAEKRVEELTAERDEWKSQALLAAEESTPVDLDETVDEKPKQRGGMSAKFADERN